MHRVPTEINVCRNQHKGDVLLQQRGTREDAVPAYPVCRAQPMECSCHSWVRAGEHAWEPPPPPRLMSNWNATCQAMSAYSSASFNRWRGFDKTLNTRPSHRTQKKILARKRRAHVALYVLTCKTEIRRSAQVGGGQRGARSP